MIRVLVVDDSETVRSLLVDILSVDPDIRIVGEASSGAAALEMARQLRPDVVTMDIQMPGMDGYQATERIMIEAPTPIVIVSGTVDVAEVSVSMKALKAGALALIAKPPGPLAPEFERASVELVRLVKAMAHVKVVRRWPERRAREPSGSRPRVEPSRSAVPVKAVAIAASTGGPAALYRILTELPGDVRVPLLVVQHMTEGFISGLASWLCTASARHVKVAEEGEAMAPGVVYLAPDDRHLGLSSDGAVHLVNADPIGGFRPSGSFLFESVAKVLGPAALGVILTGMGHDGVDGLRALRRAGGVIVAQDEETCVVFGMPGAAVAAGLADSVVPLPKIASYIQAAARSWR